MKIKNLLSILFLSSLMIYSGPVEEASDLSKIFTDGKATLTFTKVEASGTTGDFKFKGVIEVTEETYKLPGELTDAHKTTIKDALEGVLKADAENSDSKTAYTNAISSAFDKAKVDTFAKDGDKKITFHYVGTPVADAGGQPKEEAGADKKAAQDKSSEQVETEQVETEQVETEEQDTQQPTDSK